ncbi:helix-turn-helix domain-containing protein [Gordonia sp. NPDC058843]|uniref:AlbA family DNA-binding domain-containing protein n=1 Tax=Gordonia sp. NPDC058843 TaxID=3346648 RepID=UPI003674BB60
MTTYDVRHAVTYRHEAHPMALWSNPELETILGGPLEQDAITEDDLRNLVTAVPAESEFVDYKSGIGLIEPDQNPRWTSAQEHARDVCAAANSRGAILVYGIEDHKKTAVIDERMVPIPDNPDKDRHAIADHLRREIREHATPVPLVDVIYVDAAAGGFYLVVVIAPSPLAPHAVMAVKDGRKPLYYFLRQPGETNIRPLTEYEVAERYAARALGAEQRRQHLEQLWEDGVDELESSERLWIAVAAAPDLPAADSRLTPQARNEIEQWADERRFPDSLLGLRGAALNRPFPAPGRVVYTHLVDTGDGLAPGVADSYLEVHADGSMFAALALESVSDKTNAISIDSLIDDIRSLTTCALDWMSERTGSWGNASIVAGIAAAGIPYEATVTLNETGGTHAFGLRRVPTRRLPKATTVVDLASITAAQDLLAVAYNAALPLVQAFGVTEPNWITHDGGIHFGHLVSRNGRALRAWARDNGVPQH